MPTRRDFLEDMRGVFARRTGRVNLKGFAWSERFCVARPAGFKQAAMEKLSIPKGITVFKSDSGVVIRWTWRTWGSYVLLAFLVIWVSAAVAGMTHLHGHPPVQTHMARHRLSVISSPAFAPVWFGLVGLLFGYVAMGGLFNQTDVTISEGGVRVVTRPLPMSVDRDVQAAMVQGVLVRQQRSRNSAGYSVMYLNPAGKERMLVSSMMKEEQAEFIAASIRQILGLSDAPDDEAESKIF
jgi:hypothetical protein